MGKISLEYLKEFETEELEAEIARRKAETSKTRFPSLSAIEIPEFKMEVDPDGTFHMRSPGFCGSVIWDSSIEWAILSTDSEFIIHDKGDGCPDELYYGEKGPFVYKRTVRDGRCSYEYVGVLLSPIDAGKREVVSKYTDW